MELDPRNRKGPLPPGRNLYEWNPLFGLWESREHSKA